MDLAAAKCTWWALTDRPTSRQLTDPALWVGHQIESGGAHLTGQRLKAASWRWNLDSRMSFNADIADNGERRRWNQRRAAERSPCRRSVSLHSSSGVQATLIPQDPAESSAGMWRYAASAA